MSACARPAPLLWAAFERVCRALCFEKMRLKISDQLVQLAREPLAVFGYLLPGPFTLSSVAGYIV
jgi:hypothetical protein